MSASLKKENPVENALFVGSIKKSFDVLRAFTREKSALTLSEITKISNLQKSAAQRFVFTLLNLGYLKRDENTRQYRLSPKLLEFSSIYLQSDPLIALAQPFMARARDVCGHSVNLSILDGSDITILARMPSDNVVSLNVQVGIRIPALYTSSGRAIASHLNDSEINALLQLTEIRKYTEHSFTSKKRIFSDIMKARNLGYYVSYSQYIENDISVAAAILNSQKAPLAAVSIGALGGPKDVNRHRRKMAA